MFGPYLEQTFLSVPFIRKCQHDDYLFSTTHLFYKNDT